MTMIYENNSSVKRKDEKKQMVELNEEELNMDEIKNKKIKDKLIVNEINFVLENYYKERLVKLKKNGSLLSESKM